MSVYAGVLIDKAARKRALQSRAEFAVEEQASEDSESDADDIPNAGLLPELKKKSAAKKAKAASKDKGKAASKQEDRPVDDVDEGVNLRLDLFRFSLTELVIFGYGPPWDSCNSIFLTTLG